MAEMPPLPPPALRQDEGLTTSELLPFRSKKISLLHSRALVPLVLTALACMMFFFLKFSATTLADYITYMNMLAVFFVLAMFTGIYYYSGERRNMLWYVIPGVIVYIELKFLLSQFIFVFRTILPGHVDDLGPNAGFISTFIAYTFGAGYMEELIKGVPMLIGLFLAFRLRSTGHHGNALTRGMTLEGPIDGLLMGCAAGAAFILFETLLQYVPHAIQEGLRQHNNNGALAILLGLTLLIPRVLNGIIGHMAYAGIFGYFIGLAVSHPRAWIKLVLIGWTVSALLHGFWDAAASVGMWLLVVSAVLTFFVFIACLMKAKQLEISRLGLTGDGLSILATSPTPAMAGTAAGAPAPAATGTPAAGSAALSGVMGSLAGAFTSMEKMIGVHARPTVPLPPAPTTALIPPEVPAVNLSIGTGATRYALAPNQSIDFSALFGSEGVPPGCSGMIVPGASGTMEIRNAGTTAWSGTAADGTALSTPPGSSLRAAPGTRINLGSATVDIQPF